MEPEVGRVGRRQENVDGGGHSDEEEADDPIQLPVVDRQESRLQPEVECAKEQRDKRNQSKVRQRRLQAKPVRERLQGVVVSQRDRGHEDHSSHWYSTAIQGQIGAGAGCGDFHLLPFVARGSAGLPQETGWIPGGRTVETCCLFALCRGRRHRLRTRRFDEGSGRESALRSPWRRSGRRPGTPRAAAAGSPELRERGNRIRPG